MHQIGQALKNARLQKGLSLAQVEEYTKIKKSYLLAIEVGKLDSIPGGVVYQKGFIRSYAKAVNIDSEPLIAHFQEVINPKPIPIIPAEDSKLKRVTHRVLATLGFKGFAS